MAVLLSVGCLGFWIPDFIGENVAFRALFSTLGLTLLNALFFVVLIYQRGITRKLDSLPFVLYLLVCSTIPAIHTEWLGQVVILLVQAVFLLIMKSYRQPSATEPAFLASILLGIGTLILPDLIFLLPVLWVMLIVHRAFGLRELLASIIGGSVVAFYAILFSHLGWLELVDWSDIWVRASISVYPLLTRIFIAVLGMGIMIINLTRQNIENTQITTFVWSLMLVFIPCSVLMFFPSAYFLSLFIVALYSFTALLTYFFSASCSVGAGIFFLCFIALYIGQYFLTYLL